jgi:hypothetical protein
MTGGGFCWLHVGPIDICPTLAHERPAWPDKPCASCGTVEDWLWAGNCEACCQKAMQMPRGVCGWPNMRVVEPCPQGSPRWGHTCNLPGDHDLAPDWTHEGPRTHECACGVTW